MIRIYSKIIIRFASLCHFKADALLNTRAIIAKVKHQNSRVVLTSIGLIFTLNSYVAMAPSKLSMKFVAPNFCVNDCCFGCDVSMAISNHDQSCPDV